jgi:DMSO reductase anchor subunit
MPALLSGLNLLGYSGGIPGWALCAASLIAFVVGLIGIACSAGIYLIPARPAWNSWRTPAQFYLSGFLLASATGFVCVVLTGGVETVWAWLAAVPVMLFAISQAIIPWLMSIDSMREPAVRQTAQMLTGQFGQFTYMRTAYMVLAAALAPASIFVKPASASIAMSLAMLVFVLLAEVIGRYLFFVTVVPRNMAGSFFTSKPSH